MGYSITPSLRAAASVNTDFAEVEVDERRVNLTRFPLRFPEQRDFFLEGSGVFNFAGRNGVSPYFSRRIGLRSGRRSRSSTVRASAARPVDMSWGSYKWARTTTSASAGRTSRSPGSSGASSSSRLSGRSTRVVGGYGHHGSHAVRQSHGRDGSGPLDLEPLWRSKLSVRGVLRVELQPRSATDRSASELTARGFRINFPNDEWQGHVSYREFGEAYDPAVGFVNRNDFRRVEPRVAWRPRPAVSWIRTLQFDTQFRYLESLGGGVPEERQWQFGLLGLDFESGTT